MSFRAIGNGDKTTEEVTSHHWSAYDHEKQRQRDWQAVITAIFRGTPLPETWSPPPGFSPVVLEILTRRGLTTPSPTAESPSASAALRTDGLGLLRPPSPADILE